MKKLLTIIALLSLTLVANDTNTSGVNYKVMPIVSSNPNSGTSAGAMASVIYQADKDSSPSQGIVTAQYSNTDSYHVFAINKMFFDSDKFLSNTILGYIFNNTEFDTGTIDIPIALLEENPQFDVTMKVIGQQLLYEFFEDIYFGGMAYYVDQQFSAQNSSGAAFLLASGITNSKRGGIGGIIQYDTRDKTEKFFPRDAEFITLSVNYNPKAIGADESFGTANINARLYRHGFKSDDVIASQIYLTTAGKNAPDGALAALGARNILRGFSIGQYKARNMAALQSEYRYQITGTRFRLAAFAGFANLSGGSKGNSIVVNGKTLTGNRDDNNGNYYSGGLGVRYTIQKKAGVDYRLDVAHTSTNETSIYATVNQAF